MCDQGAAGKNKSFNEIPYIGQKTDLAFDRDIGKWMENHVEKANNESYVDNVQPVSKWLKTAVVGQWCPKYAWMILRDQEHEFKNTSLERPTYHLMFQNRPPKLDLCVVVQENHKEARRLTTL